jgi:hypothetical protein
MSGRTTALTCRLTCCWCAPQTGSTQAATFQLTCISLGVGIFVMPSVFSAVGMGVGTGLVLMFAVLSDVAMQLMIKAAIVTKSRSYDEVNSVLACLCCCSLIYSSCCTVC